MIGQSVKMAWKSIMSNKTRSFLTMLGIIIGVLSLVVLVSLVSSTTDSVTDQISGIATNLLSVTVQDDKGNPLKLDDVNEFMELDNISETAPVAQSSVTASNTYSEEDATVYGTTAAYQNIQGLTLASGRFLLNSDVENHTNVAVINADLATDVIGRTNAVGETISLNGMDYQIIGVLESDDSSTSSLLGNTYEVYIPFTSLVRLTSTASSNVTTFYASPENEEDTDAAEETLTNALLERFGNDEDAFSVFNQSVIAEVMESVTGMLSLLLGGIAAISLLVGGIGIMNIMLVSVSERTREIGIRKAIGASRGTIMLQFLIEALMVSLIGCLIGIIFSVIVIAVIAQIAGSDITFHISSSVVWISVIFSAGIGVIFGIYPANKAAKMKPIDALRYTG